MNLTIQEMVPDSDSDSAMSTLSFDTSAFAQDDVARLVIGENGKIAFSSSEFGKVVDRSSYAMVGTKVKDVISFVDVESAFDQSQHAIEMQSSRAQSNEDVWTKSILGGVHDVQFFGDEDHAFSCRFDWITLPDERRFLILSVDGERPVLKAVAPEKASAAKGFSAAQNMQLLMALSHESMVVFGRDGIVDMVNDVFASLLGKDKKTISGRSFYDFIHADDRSRVRDALSAEGFDPIQIETRLLDASGEMKFVDWRFQLLGSNVYASGRDLTEIMQKETVLAKRQAQLREAQAIGRMGHWYWRIGDQNFDFSNEIYRIFGVDREEFAPTLDNLISMVHKHDVDRMLQVLQRAMIERQTYDMEFRICRQGGEIRHIHCEGRSEIDAEGDVIALFGIMQDITERHEYERDMREAKESAERAYATKSQFLANMSHELRTPLNAIIGFSEMIERQLLGPIGNDKYLEYITGIRESGVHLLDLISDILDMSKIEAGKYELVLEDVNVGKVINLALHMMEGRALESSVKLSTNATEEGPVIRADRRAVMQVVLNLLSNAVKFSKDSGKVEVKCQANDKFVMFKVIDNGVGIPADRLSAVTKPFEQAANALSRDHEGSGLGLAITKELIELHGGNMRIESTEGVGTSVMVRLPLEAAV